MTKWTLLLALTTFAIRVAEGSLFVASVTNRVIDYDFTLFPVFSCSGFLLCSRLTFAVLKKLDVFSENAISGWIFLLTVSDSVSSNIV